MLIFAVVMSILFISDITDLKNFKSKRINIIYFMLTAFVLAGAGFYYYG